MNCSTNTELTDIHFVYGLINRNGRAVVHCIGKGFKTTRIPNPQMFAHVQKNLSEHEFFTVAIHNIGCLDVYGLSLEVSSHGPSRSLDLFPLYFIRVP
ncbi:hypothetical protein AVEN_77386-1 [Araneus ventricosus]|uniref:Uncharacterized protein n=1 Tax=Araneus ventricosus TaxID=182803 RepID=A0A4Y2CBA4_ARAVE|nr:hypothetical protein AVEN_77386-1 [Araneus ventricosus]